ncbi:MAG: hypothetical protein ACI9WU_002250 [Myxococcota bacterium]
MYGELKKQDAATLEGHAKDLGMDVAQFKADVKDPALLVEVRMNFEAGKKIGVRGTPSMYLNGAKMDARDFEQMKTAVTAELAEVDKLVAGGASITDARQKRMVARGGAAYLDFVQNRKGIKVDTSPPKPPAPPKPTPPDTTVYQAEIFEGDQQKGNDDALVTIVECTDFQ